MPERRGAAPTATLRRATGRRAAGSASRLVTFDVFETVLVRAVSPHHAVFDIVGERARERGLIGSSAVAFSKARQWAERRAQRTHRDGTSLEHIYAELGATLMLTGRVRRELAELEMAVEAELLRPVPSVLPHLAAERDAAGRLVYVSDMYLPADFIQEQLRRHGLWQDGDVLYVSHTHGRTKRSGRLFELVAEQEGVRVDAVRHYGNDQSSDLRGAARAGARGILLPAGNPNRYERSLQEHRDATDGLTAAMAGASRLARLSCGADSARDRALVEVAAGVMAPVLTCYVLWLLRRARALGLRRLYFVARDGQVLLRIAERLAPRMGLDIELRYLYASRLVWNRVASSPSRNPQVWHSLVGLSSDGVSNRDVLERTGIGHDAVERVVAESGVGPEAWSSFSDRAPLLASLERIEADGTLARAQEHNKQVVLRYLEEQGLLDGVPHGFVDVGWRGTQHDVLAELQTERGVGPGYGLFFGLDKSITSWAHLREAWFFDNRGAEGDAATHGELVPLGGSYLPDARTSGGTPIGLAQFALVEIFCSGDHGTLTDYEEAPDGVRPVLSSGREEATSAWGLPLVWRTVDVFVDSLPDDAVTGHRHVDVHQALTQVMTLFWTWPTRAEVAVWAGFPWEVGQGTRQRIVELARRYRLTDLAADIAGAPMSVPRLKQAVRRAQKSEWLAASLVQSPLTTSLVLRPRATLRHVVGRAGRGLKAEVAKHPRLRSLLGG